MLTSCGGRRTYRGQDSELHHDKVSRLKYSVQVGAFSELGNAARYTESLKDKGIDAYYFLYKTGMYKVRFGDYGTKEKALSRAEKLRLAGVISDYYIVSPEEYSIAKRDKFGDKYLRDRIISTAKSFLGTPYKWGGSSRRGLDCSGLTMTVYKINGMKLPRSSSRQYKKGDPVERKDLRKGDLVFFATNGGRKVSHVGIYTGYNSFIHAPNKGKGVQIDSLSKSYYAKNYVGARRYF
ncbi:MAG: C40 family peptidase [Nitrospirota bacterium]|nr:MAG: C40 family peptidase [Nitrospirota bacterium]